MPQYVNLAPGQPAPTFTQRCTSNPQFVFDTVAGRYIVLCFFGSAGSQPGMSALEVLQTHRHLFDDDFIAFFGVSMDPQDEVSGRAQQAMPGIRHFWDFDGHIGRLYGVLPLSAEGQQIALRPRWVVLDPGLNVLSVIPFAADGSDTSALVRQLERLAPLPRYTGMDTHAPIIMLPNVLEAELCRRLVDEYDRNGGIESGVMKEIDGKTVGVYDSRHKRRDDFLIEDAELRASLQRRVQLKVIPIVRKAFCFEITRMERYIVGRYEAASGGHFKPHRDNTTKGTAHRRFALSVNLNDGFTGGSLSFPEYGPRAYDIPPGAAIVFSGSLLHAVSPVTKGVRYAFLPFLYDEAAAQQRELNNPHLDPSVGEYRSSS